jgi:hypothetical protein
MVKNQWRAALYTGQQISCTVQTICLLATNYLTNFMERSPFQDATKSSDGHEIPRILWNWKVHYRFLNNPPLVLTLSQINPSQPLLSYSRKIRSFIPLPYAECDNSLPFSEASSIPPCYTRFPATFLHQSFSHPPSLHPAIYFFVYLLVLLFPNSYISFGNSIFFHSLYMPKPT